jgi:hypothetical protein
MDLRWTVKSFKQMASVLMYLGVMLVVTTWSVAGSFPPESEFEPYGPVSKDDPEIVAWAGGWQNYQVGTNVDLQWQNPDEALGQAEGTSFDIVSLGRGGEITLTFVQPITDGEGWDFAVFENSAIFYEETHSGFLELAYVEVSTDGVHFIRFDNVSQTQSPLPGFGTIDNTEIHGLAGKYKQGQGTPFELSDLAYKQDVASGVVDLNNIGFVKIIDIVGDGTDLENRPPGWGENGPIYDPYPTVGSAGFDLDGVCVRNQLEQSNNLPAMPLPFVLLLLLND